MKKKFSAVLAGLLVAAVSSAAPLMETTAIHSQSDAGSPAIGYLKAGTDPIAAANATVPAGWMAVDLPGPHEAYVNNNDFSKSLDIHAGAAIRLKPKADAPVLATMQEGDKTEITGLRSGWTQIKLHKTIVGYIQVGGPLASSSSAPAPAPVMSVAAAPVATPAPSPVPVSAGPAAALPRVLQGMLVETKRLLFVGPRPDYRYQLNDPAGKRIGFLDVSKVAPLQRIETYTDQLVTISGVIKPTSDWKNLVIEVQTLEAR
jgi:Bacterial SH3 domain